MTVLQDFRGRKAQSSNDNLIKVPPRRVRPHDQHSPTRRSQRANLPLVTGAIRSDFLRPVSNSRLGRFVMDGASVPEATMDQYDGMVIREDLVKRHPSDSTVAAESHSKPAKRASEDDFGLGVLPAHPRH
jgi:hypothetical protein